MKKTQFILLCVVALSCAQPKESPEFSEQTFEQHVATLASDDFQGRLPFTEGEKKTVAYLQEQFKSLGLEPGNGTSYLQEVPMVEITATTDPEMIIKKVRTASKGEKETLIKGRDGFVLWTERTEPAIEFKDDEIVFAGFGAVAPEYNWNDYEGLDVKGKIVLVLVNDPGFGGVDTTFFKGSTMTYYGRWTYKFEEAARQGAKACFVIHNDIPAGYAFNVPQNNWNSPHLYLDRGAAQDYKCAGVGWIPRKTAEQLFTIAGQNFADQQSAARKPGFKGTSLGLTATVGMTVKSKNDKSYNLIGKITGRTKPDEYVLYTAHWDHIGVGNPDESGDSINNGAEDNASGTAGLLELARIFKSGEQPERTILFLAVTAEEQGLQGSAYYAQNPIYPIDKTVANINIDGLGSYGKMKDIVVIGNGQSQLEDYLSEEAKKAGRYVAREPNPVAGYYFRSDHFNFAKVGIPALFTGTGIDHVEKGRDYGQRLQDEFLRKHYHQPSDEYDSATWNSDGAISDLTLLYLVGKRLAYGNEWPEWKKSSEFRQLREK
ncbi:MAG TPA: M28 family metallopeptidase [Cyclobacteriaceae bacterium]|nr:M28 family metallopeptidase [Cyclobacteriaceae bacterium]